jgi:hypothetical protein
VGSGSKAIDWLRQRDLENTFAMRGGVGVGVVSGISQTTTVFLLPPF